MEEMLYVPHLQSRQRLHKEYAGWRLPEFPSILGILSASLIYILLLSSPAHAQSPELSAEKTQDFISAILPYPLDFVRNTIRTQFDSDARAFYEDYNGAIYELPQQARTIHDLGDKTYRKFIAFPIARRNKFYVFYGAYPNMQHILQEISPYSVLGMDNPALKRYAGLPAAMRSDDIYLWSPDTPYWYSGYTANGNSLPFRSYFIVHLSAVDTHHTDVEIIEDQPVVNMGRKLSVDANGVVHRFDIENVAPTASDREYLLYCINQFIERRVPSRHVFNCLTPEELEDLKKRQ
jgi:hypothetical protein